MIYDYLFYKYYFFTIKQGGSERGAMGLVSMGILFNAMAICFFLEGLGVRSSYLELEYVVVYASALLLLVRFYYSQRKYLLLNKYEDREQSSAWTLHPIAVFLLYSAGSFGLLLLAGLFRNKDWMFAR